MADRRDFFREIAQESRRSLVDLLGIAVRATEDPGYLVRRFLGGEPDAPPREEVAAPSAVLPAAADLWVWPEVPPPFVPDGEGGLSGPSPQSVTSRPVQLEQLLLGGLTVPGGGWVALPAGSGASYASEQPTRVVALAGREQTALQSGGHAPAEVRRVGVALGSGHEAWVQAAWREMGLPEPEVLVGRSDELPAMRADGTVDALVVREGGSRSLPRWVLLAPRAWVLPTGWESALRDPWRRLRPGEAADGLRWLYGRPLEEAETPS